MEFRACNGEIPPCSFETARRLLIRNTNNELLPIYDRQLCECYLQPQILRCECLGDNSKLHQRVGSCSCHLSFLSSPSAITKLSPTIRHLNYNINFIPYLSLKPLWSTYPRRANQILKIPRNTLPRIVGDHG